MTVDCWAVCSEIRQPGCCVPGVASAGATAAVVVAVAVPCRETIRYGFVLVSLLGEALCVTVLMCVCEHRVLGTACFGVCGKLSVGGSTWLCLYLSVSLGSDALHVLPPVCTGGCCVQPCLCVFRVV